jgi:hypothetical protein
MGAFTGGAILSCYSLSSEIREAGVLTRLADF